MLSAPFWALTLLYYWRAVGEGRRGYWFLTALALGLLLLANYAGVILLALIVVFTLATSPGRASFRHAEPWVAIPLFAIVVFPHAAWLETARDLVISGASDSKRRGRPLAARDVARPDAGGEPSRPVPVGGARQRLAEEAPPLARPRAGDRSQSGWVVRAGLRVFFRAGARNLRGCFCIFQRQARPLDRVAPLVLLSGLAVVVAAGDQVFLYRERMASSAWLGLLVVPPALVVLGLFVMPWTLGVDLRIAQPARAEGQFFGENFQRRTGKKLEFVTGDARIAPLVALSAPTRPRLYFAWAPERSPWATPVDIVTRGSVLVWPASDNSGTPPTSLRAQFPTMVPEVPRSFARSIQGRLPLIRIGWAAMRPINP